MPINDVHGGDLVILHSVWDKRRSRVEIFLAMPNDGKNMQTPSKPFKDHSKTNIQYSTSENIRTFKNID